MTIEPPFNSGRLRRLHPCANPACPRKTSALYCCGPCDVAHQGHYDPDGYHSDGCNERAVNRGTR